VKEIYFCLKIPSIDFFNKHLKNKIFIELKIFPKISCMDLYLTCLMVRNVNLQAKSSSCNPYSYVFILFSDTKIPPFVRDSRIEREEDGVTTRWRKLYNSKLIGRKFTLTYYYYYYYCY